MSVVSDLRRAYRLVQQPAGSVQAGEAAVAGLDVRTRVERLTGRYHGHGLWRALFAVLRRDVWAYLVPAVLLVALTPVVPWALDRAVTALDTHERDLGVALVVFGGVVVLHAVLRWTCTWRVRRLVVLVELCVQRLLFRRLSVVDRSWLRDRQRSMTAYLLTYPQRMSQLPFLLQVVADGVVVAALLVYLAVGYGPVVAGVVVAVTGVLVLPQRFVIARLAATEQEYAVADHRRTALLDVIGRGWQSIRRQYLEAQVFATLRRVRETQNGTLRRRAWLSTVAETSRNALGLVVSVVAVGATWLTGAVTDPASLFALLVAVRLVLHSVTEMLSLYEVLRSTAEATGEIDEIFGDAPVVRPRTRPVMAPGEVTVDGARIHAGERVAVVGPSGSGKSRLLDRILVDAHTGESAGGHGGAAVLVARAQPLFDGTVAELVTLWEPDVDERRYVHAVSASGLDSDLRDRPGGDASMISGTDVRLSEGQTVRLSLAQALAVDPDVLLLDDVFAPLDPHTARTVADRVLGADGPTRIFVTTRLELVHHADRVLLVGHDDTLLLTPAAIREDTAPDRARQILGDDLYERLRAALGTTRAEPTPVAPAVDYRRHTFDGATALAGDAYESTPDAAGGFGAFVRNATAVFPPVALAGLLLAVVGFVAADLAFSATVQHWNATDAPAAMAVLAVCTVVALGTAAARAALTYRTVIPVIDRLHNAIFRSLLSCSADNRRSAVVGRLVRDFVSLELMTPAVFVDLTTGTVRSVAAVALIGVASPPALLLLAPLLLVAAWLVRTTRSPVTASTHLSAALRGPVITFGAAALTGRAYHLSEPFRRKLSHRFDHLATLRAAGMHRVMMCRLRILLTVEAVATAVCLVAAAGAALVPAGSPVGAGLLLFVTYTFSREIATLVERAQTADTLVAELARLSDILDRPVLPRPGEVRSHTPLDARPLYDTLLTDDGPTNPDGTGPAVTATDLTVTAPDGRTLLDTATFTVPRGATVAVTGPSGTGKSLLAQTLTGARPPASGQVLLDGGLTPDVFGRCTRAAVAIADSDVPALPLTVTEFIDPWQDSGDTEATLRRICAAAGTAAPALDTLIDHLGHGQRQLVNLARLLTHAPPLLVLDEATSALDSRAERDLLKAAKDLAPGTTLLVILHRVDNQDRAADVLHLSKGTIGAGTSMPAAG